MSQTVEKSPPAEVTPPADEKGRGRWLPTVVSAGVLLVATAGFLLVAVAADMPAPRAAVALLAVLVTQVLPGFLVWRVVRPLRGWWVEDVVMGFAVGVALAIAAQIVAGLTGLDFLSGGIGLALAAALLAVPRTRRRILRVRNEALPLWWMPLVVATSLIGLQGLQRYFITNPLVWSGGFRRPHVDAYLHLALAGQLKHRGPVSFPWVEDSPMAYHWFSHAWMAQVSTVSGMSLDAILFRFMPALMPLAIVLVVAIAAVRLTGRPWTGPVAGVLVMAGAELNLFGLLNVGYPLNAESPSLGISVPLMVAIVVLLAFRWRGGMSRAGLVLLPFLSLAASGTKGSTMPLIVGGLGVALVAMVLFDRSRVRGLLIDLALTAGALIVAMIVVFRGSGAGLQLKLDQAAQATPGFAALGNTGVAAMVLASVMTLLGIMARGTGVLWRVGTPEGRRDPVTWLLLGGGFAGAAATVVFAHPGRSQYYFARAAGPLMALASVVGLVVLVDRLGRRGWKPISIGVLLGPAFLLLPTAILGRTSADKGARHAVAMLAVAAGVLAVAGVIAMLVTPQQRAAAFAAAVTCAILAGGVTTVAKYQLELDPLDPLPKVKGTAPLAVSREQINAARWIRNHSGEHDLVMTNRHCIAPTAPDNCDSRHYTVSAFSERQLLVEAWTPTSEAYEIAPNGRESITVNYWKPDILALNDGFVAQPDEAKKRRLQELGVRWIMVDFTRPHAPTLEPFAIQRMRNRGAAVYELPPA